MFNKREKKGNKRMKDRGVRQKEKEEQKHDRKT